MTELGETDQALAVLEELRPGVTSPNFEPQNNKQLTLQFAAVLALEQSQSREETLRLLDAVVPRWDQSFPNWRQGSGWVAAIEMARGNTKLAIDWALKDLSVENEVDAEETVLLSTPLFSGRHWHRSRPLRSASPNSTQKRKKAARKSGPTSWRTICSYKRVWL